ncbi:alpha/beta fold hydrolase [Flavobacterium sp. J27]|uniref:alpha/beta fold hydrolase n=1 Tax=Flavobacterium sp. J27 TaxID=2060419 RepID=UPI00103081A7|nr:alpha/beta hydrolase [Flavobacterium sp. J27]
MPIVNNAFEDFKPEYFDNSPLQIAYNIVAPDKTKWGKFLQQMFEFAEKPFNCGDANIAKIPVPTLLISGDNDGLDKVELMKTYQLLGSGITADMQTMSKSHLVIVPSQGHVNLMMQTKTILEYLHSFLNE